MDLEEARAIAEQALDQHVRSGVAEDVVLTTLSEYPQRWVADYNTRSYWETRSVRHALAGNGPIIIDKATGGVRFATSALRTNDQVKGDGVVRWTIGRDGQHVCPVCGFGGLYEPAWKNAAGSHEICRCCGTHLGYDDAAGGRADERQRRHRELREQWKLSGCPWFSRTRRPPVDWDPETQLRVVSE